MSAGKGEKRVTIRINVRRHLYRTSALAASVLLVSTAGCTGTGKQPAPDPGDAVKGPHRVEASAAPGAGAGPETGAGGHRWIALSQRWRVAQADEAPHLYGLGAAGGTVVAIRAKAGAELPDPVEKAEVTGYDAASGRQLWRVSLQWIPEIWPVGADGIVVLATGLEKDGGIENGELVALDAATGAERWRRRVTRPAYPLRKNVPPGVFAGGAFYYADGPDLFALDPATGAERLEHTGKTVRIVAGPVLVADQLAMVVEDDPAKVDLPGTHLFVVKQDFTLAQQYQYPNRPLVDSLSAAGDVLVSWAEDTMYAVDRRTGKQLWSAPVAAGGTPAPPVGGVVPVLSSAAAGPDATIDSVYGLDLLTGKERWRLGPKEGQYRERHLRVADGTLFALGHAIEIIDCASGKVIFTRPANRGGDLAVAAGDRIVTYTGDSITGFE